MNYPWRDRFAGFLGDKFAAFYDTIGNTWNDGIESSCDLLWQEEKFDYAKLSMDDFLGDYVLPNWFAALKDGHPKGPLAFREWIKSQQSGILEEIDEYTCLYSNSSPWYMDFYDSLGYGFIEFLDSIGQEWTDGIEEGFWSFSYDEICKDEGRKKLAEDWLAQVKAGQPKGEEAFLNWLQSRNK